MIAHRIISHHREIECASNFGVGTVPRCIRLSSPQARASHTRARVLSVQVGHASLQLLAVLVHTHTYSANSDANVDASMSFPINCRVCAGCQQAAAGSASLSPPIPTTAWHSFARPAPAAHRHPARYAPTRRDIPGYPIYSGRQSRQRVARENCSACAPIQK